MLRARPPVALAGPGVEVLSGMEGYSCRNSQAPTPRCPRHQAGGYQPISGGTQLLSSVHPGCSPPAIAAEHSLPRRRADAPPVAHSSCQSPWQLPWGAGVRGVRQPGPRATHREVSARDQRTVPAAAKPLGRRACRERLNHAPALGYWLREVGRWSM